MSTHSSGPIRLKIPDHRRRIIDVDDETVLAMRDPVGKRADVGHDRHHAPLPRLGEGDAERLWPDRQMQRHVALGQGIQFAGIVAAAVEQVGGILAAEDLFVLRIRLAEEMEREQ